MPNMGRKIGAPAKNRVNIVLTDEQLKSLDECCQELRWTRTEVIREGIARVRKELPIKIQSDR